MKSFLPVHVDSIPEELRRHPHWIVWRVEERLNNRTGKLEPTKVPYNGRTGARGDATDVGTAMPFDEAVKVYERSEGFYSGIGIIGLDDSPFTGVDLDKCVTAGVVDSSALMYVRMLDSYTEISPSGRGLRVFVIGKKPGERCRKGSIEIYDRDRFLTVTGHHLEGTPQTIIARQDELSALYQLVFGPDEAEQKATPIPTATLDKSDAELLETMFRAKNGPEIERLWRGDTSLHGGDDSAADLALCNHLAFYTQGDAGRIDSLFRQSGLMRPKWDEKRGEKTYGQMTIEKALNQGAYYDAGHKSPIMQGSPSENTLSPERLERDLDGLSKSDAQKRLLDVVDLAKKWEEPDLRKAKLIAQTATSAGFARDWIGVIRSSKQAKNERYTADKIADRITAANHFAVDEGRKLYVYDQGVYRDEAEQMIRREVKTLLNEESASDQWTTKLRNEVVEYIRDDAPRLWDKPPADTINILNGLFHVPTRELRPHSPDFLSRVQFPVKYDPAAKCNEIQKWAYETLGEANAHIIEELAALVMMPDNPADQAVMLRGPGGNGKSIFLAIILAFIGKENAAAVSLQKLTSSRFAANRLVGKMANICPDLPSGHLSETDIFKRITGGDPVNTEYKHGADFDFLPHCKLLFSANETPTSSDTTDAYFRRWVIIPFNRRFEGSARVKRDVLLKRLTSPREMSGLLNLAIARWNAVAEHGISQTQSMKDAHLRFMEQSSPITAWLSEHVVKDGDGQIECGRLFEAYKEYARQNRLTIPSAKDFGNKVRAFHPAVNVVLRYPDASTRRVKHYAGLRWAEDFGEPLSSDTDDTDNSIYRTGEIEHRGGVLNNACIDIQDVTSNGIIGITR